VSESNELTIRDNPAASRIEADVGGVVAYAQYRVAPGTVTFTHTLVPEAFRGRGIGTRLIQAGLAMARDRGLQVIAQCPFFSAYFRAHPEQQKLLAAEGQKLTRG
jgi:uncharacterized protein